MNSFLESHKKSIEVLLDILADFLGSFLFAISIHMFTAPNQIAPGGVSGICIIINYLTGFPIGLASFLINIPLLILGFKFIGKKFTVRTLKSVVILSVMLDFMEPILPTYQGNMILASLFGGIMMGIGLAVIFMRDSTTGGTDILSRLIQQKLPHVQMGKILLSIDFVVLILSAITFKNLEAMLYGIIAIYANAKMVDAILYGWDTGKLLFIISPNNAQIAEQILKQLDRGATFLDGTGAFSGEKKDVLLCAVRKNQFYRVKSIVYSIDPDAFLIVTETGEVIGEGFKKAELN